MSGSGRREYLREVLTVLWPPPARVTHGRAGHRGGAGNVTGFLVFPGPHKPVLLVPYRPRRATAAALRGYKASAGLRDRLQFRGAALAAAAGVAQLLPGRVMIERAPAAGSTGPHGAADGAPDIVAHLREVLGPGTMVALHIGAARANRKPVLQAITAGGEVAGFVKVGVSPLTNELVRAEAAALAFLGGVPLSALRPPRLLHHGRWRGHEVLVQQAFAAGRPAGGPSQLTAAMSELASVRGVSRLPLAGSPYWLGLRSRLMALPQAGPAGTLLSALDALGPAGQATTLAFGSWHGDWTPWNMTLSGGQALVWDWERFATGVPVGYDAVHYRLQGDIVRGGADPAAAARAVLAQAAAVLAPLGVERAAAGLVAALYLTEIASRYLAEGQAEAGARLGRVETWLLPALTRHVSLTGPAATAGPRRTPPAA